MNLDKVANIAGAIIGVAMVTTIVASPNTASVIKAMGEAFTGSLRTAMGR